MLTVFYFSFIYKFHEAADIGDKKKGFDFFIDQLKIQI